MQLVARRLFHATDAVMTLRKSGAGSRGLSVGFGCDEKALRQHAAP